jgi:hypothetical protein
MTHYVVSWVIDQEADTPLEAAREVATEYFQERIALGEPGTACVFQVAEAGRESLTKVQVDLADERQKTYRRVYGPREG